MGDSRLRTKALILALSVSTGTAWSASANTRDEIPPFTYALDERLQPTCPPPCATGGISFTATYKRGRYVLVFVGAKHVFTPQNSTIRAVASGFAAAHPAIVIVEGFPTAMGENPLHLVEEAHRFGTVDADDYAKGEPMYAASLALHRGVPFLGGELTRAEEVQGLLQKDFSPTDISFAFVLRGMAFSIQAGDARDARDPRFRDAFERTSNATTRDFELPPMSFDKFSGRYRELFGVDLESDSDLPLRASPGTSSQVAILLQANMIARDEHMLVTIMQQLEVKRRVLIVYGKSHWTTLSSALERRLGKPAIVPFQE